MTQKRNAPASTKLSSSSIAKGSNASRRRAADWKEAKSRTRNYHLYFAFTSSKGSNNV